MNINLNTSKLFNELPKILGAYRFNYPLSKITWFKVGGIADVMYIPSSIGDLRNFLVNLSSEINITVIGVGSNLLVRDGGISDVVIKLGKDFNFIEQIGSKLIVGAGALDILVSKFARDKSITGLEFLSGIPGTIGGAISMNSGAYNKEIADILISADVMDRRGKIHTIFKKDILFSYRNSNYGKDLILIGAILKGEFGIKDLIDKKMQEIYLERIKSQPVRKKTGGSTFKNPLNSKLKAWELIHQSGCRGLTRGGAMVSNLHCNFLINTSSATADDLESLGEDIKAKVLKKTGVDLEWEIKRIGLKSRGVL